MWFWECPRVGGDVGLVAGKGGIRGGGLQGGPNLQGPSPGFLEPLPQQTLLRKHWQLWPFRRSAGDTLHLPLLVCCSACRDLTSR